MKTTMTLMVVLAMVFSVAALGGSGVIGVAVSNGKIQVDRSEVTGNANLNDGSVLRTAGEASRIQWTSGAKAALGPNSEARVYGNRLEMQSGVGVISAGRLKASARGFEVEPTAGAQAQVAVQGGTVQVAALSGTVKVRSGDGMLLARVMPGKALDLTGGAGAAGVSTMTGTLRSESGKFLLRDEITNLDVELRGGALRQEVGRMVEVSGKAQASADRESQVIEVAKLTRMEMDPQSGGARPTDSAKKGAGKAGASGSAKAAGAGMSHGTKVLIGVLVAGGGAAGVAIPLAVMSR